MKYCSTFKPCGNFAVIGVSDDRAVASPSGAQAGELTNLRGDARAAGVGPS